MKKAQKVYDNKDREKELPTAMVAALDQHQGEDVGVDEAEAGVKIPEAEEVQTSHRPSWGQINVHSVRKKDTGNASAQS